MELLSARPLTKVRRPIMPVTCLSAVLTSVAVLDDTQPFPVILRTFYRLSRTAGAGEVAQPRALDRPPEDPAMNDITSRPQLTSGEQARIDAAAEILAAEHGYDATALAERFGVLGWHPGEVLALVAELTAAPGSRSAERPATSR